MQRVGWLAGLVAAVALGAPNAKIAEAKKNLDELELEKAAKALAAAEAQPGNDRAQTLEILRLQGIVFGTMNKEAKVRDAFRKLLILAPDFALTGDQPPRVRTPFYEAKEWVAQNEPLQLEAASGALSKGTEYVVTVRRDLLRLVKRVRFLVADGSPQEVVVENNAARLIVDGPQAAWRIELLGARDAVLLEQGPFAGPAAPAPVAAATPAPAPANAATPSSGSTGATAAQVTQRPAPAPSGWMRPTSYALLGVAVVAAGIGLGLGVDAQATRQRLAGLTPNEAGLIEGLTQRQALAQEAAARSQAMFANGLFVGAGVLAAAGVLFFLLGAPADSSAAAVGLSPSGLVVRGSF
jgi:hypothetical protein